MPTAQASLKKKRVSSPQRSIGANRRRLWEHIFATSPGLYFLSHPQAFARIPDFLRSVHICNTVISTGNQYRKSTAAFPILTLNARADSSQPEPRRYRWIVIPRV